MPPQRISVRSGLVDCAGREWAAWQEEYAFGAFYIFPPQDLGDSVDALRRIHDPVSAAICRAHVSLTEPLRSRLDEAQDGEIREVLMTLEPFAVDYGPIRGFAPHPGVALAIRPEASVRSLRDAIHSTSAFQGAAFKRAEIPPHLTIAEFITIGRSAVLLDELAGVIPSGSFECNEVVLAAPDAGFHFHDVRRFSIGPTAQ